ncbi:MAG: Hsp20/alpha crystallin family protein [Oxalobacteraceae bacterium]
MRILEELKQDVEELWESATEGWRRLRHQAAGALTRFRPGAQSSATVDIRNDFDLPAPNWALLAGDVFEDSKKIVVRLEVPGMEKSDFDIEVRDDVLIVRGEKRFETESGDGRYRVLQCAYGSFSRTIPLPAPILADQGNATYHNGVLKIELIKSEPQSSRQTQIKVS